MICLTCLRPLLEPQQPVPIRSREERMKWCTNCGRLLPSDAHAPVEITHGRPL